MAQIITLPNLNPNLNLCNPRNARNYKGEKFLVHQLKLLAVRDPADILAGRYMTDAPIGELAELCVWTGRDIRTTRFYVSLWVHASPVYVSGFGQADGVGYCKGSMASFRAFQSAGLRMTESFGGRGMTEVEKAMRSLGVALGYCRKKLYVVRGA
jgi:hypothetical protein